ncbi:hypothetical protein GM182_07040 [bacterium 3DAC]|nr:hypothetical protein GM182_07040 [bacterium 3DAC]
MDFWLSLWGLALADSVNPCCINALLVMLTLNIIKGSPVQALKSGLAFTLGIITGYMTLGGALLWGYRLLPPGVIPWLNLIIGGAGCILAVLAILDAFRGSRGLTPESEKSTIRAYLEKATSPGSSYVVGVILSFLLLPCSMGPYIVFSLKLASYTSSPVLQFLLLLLYNIIFSVPFWGLSILAYIVGNIRFVKKAKGKMLPYLEVVASILLVIIAFPLLKEGFIAIFK